MEINLLFRRKCKASQVPTLVGDALRKSLELINRHKLLTMQNHFQINWGEKPRYCWVRLTFVVLGEFGNVPQHMMRKDTGLITRRYI